MIKAFRILLSVRNSLKYTVIYKTSWLKPASGSADAGYILLHLKAIVPLLCCSIFNDEPANNINPQNNKKIPSSLSTTIQFNADDFTSTSLIVMDFAYLLENVSETKGL